MDLDQLRQPGARPLNLYQVCSLLGLARTGSAAVYRLCLRGKLDWIVTPDDRILITAESLVRYIDERDAGK
ncbi:hypothetical protein G9E11_12190 [Arthrobacter sp. IA7]|uniref:hypothetical protein n=1 Tax=Arthrobacter ipis TaxID=2716202 RepID=UPI001683BE8C|nr:hypothetical protein [Arthrobacter ipis]MBD1542991.1 hypothetical protein [Arthrobacter ipis]